MEGVFGPGPYFFCLCAREEGMGGAVAFVCRTGLFRTRLMSTLTRKSSNYNPVLNSFLTEVKQFRKDMTDVKSDITDMKSSITVQFTDSVIQNEIQ